MTCTLTTCYINYIPSYIPLTFALKIIYFLYLDTFDPCRTHTKTFLTLTLMTVTSSLQGSERNGATFVKGLYSYKELCKVELLTKVFHQQSEQS